MDRRKAVAAAVAVVGVGAQEAASWRAIVDAAVAVVDVGDKTVALA